MHVEFVLKNVIMLDTQHIYGCKIKFDGYDIRDGPGIGYWRYHGREDSLLGFFIRNKVPKHTRGILLTCPEGSFLFHFVVNTIS